MVRILVADDHEVVRNGVKKILLDGMNGLHIGEAKSTGEVLSLVRAAVWDLLILDINMPGQSGLEVLKDLQEVPYKPRVLVLSMHPEDQLAQRVLKAGASGYLTKESAPEELVAATNKILSGGNYVSCALAAQLAAEAEEGMGQNLHNSLTDREYEVLCLIGSGKTPSQIADIMTLSPRTVSGYRSRLLQKMGLETDTELIRYAVHNGIVG